MINHGVMLITMLLVPLVLEAEPKSDDKGDAASRVINKGPTFTNEDVHKVQ